LSPAWNNPIFIGINRLIAKGLANGEQEIEPIQYPCQVVNIFQCPYERTDIKEDDFGATNSHFNVEDLFKLRKMAFVVELALAKARKSDSEIQIKDKQDLFHALTDRDTLTKILEQAADILKGTDYLREISEGLETDSIVDYFIGIKDRINLEELRFY
jgi:hypothetical protein